MTKTPIIFYVIISALLFIACGESSYPHTESGFNSIEQVIQSKFGKEAYYTDISIVYNASIGNIIGVTVTEDPVSLEMGEWNNIQGSWSQESIISLEVPSGSKAADFMFQLNDKINLGTLGTLVSSSLEDLESEKNIQPALHMAYIKYPDNGNFTEAKYVVILEPESGGTSFTYTYDMNGELIAMNY